MTAKTGTIMKKSGSLLIGILLPLAGQAQEASSVFNFLKQPASAHATALGGKAISVIEDDASLVFLNPALSSSVSGNTINLNFMTYMQGSKSGSASYIQTAGEVSTWGIMAQFSNYGNITETDEEGRENGTLSSLDMALSGVYSYLFNDYWAGGVTGKFIYSGLAGYQSLGLAVDLGLNYYNEETDFSFSAVASNAGGQIKAYNDQFERIPFDLSVGFTKGMAHAPIRISVTMNDLTRWNYKYYYNPEGKEKFGTMLFNHFSLGVDLLPSSSFYLSAGYNFRRATEMKEAGKSHGAGLSFGGGLLLERFKMGVAYAQYHVSTPTLVFNVSYQL